MCRRMCNDVQNWWKSHSRWFVRAKGVNSRYQYTLSQILISGLLHKVEGRFFIKKSALWTTTTMGAKWDAFPTTQNFLTSFLQVVFRVEYLSKYIRQAIGLRLVYTQTVWSEILSNEFPHKILLQPVHMVHGLGFRSNGNIWTLIILPWPNIGPPFVYLRRQLDIESKRPDRATC